MAKLGFHLNRLLAELGEIFSPMRLHIGCELNSFDNETVWQCTTMWLLRPSYSTVILKNTRPNIVRTEIDLSVLSHQFQKEIEGYDDNLYMHNM